MKIKPVYQFRLRRDAKLLGWGYLASFVGLWFIPFLIRWMTSGFKAALPLKPYLATNALESIMVLFLFVVGALVYQGFELFIQNGISRRTYWTGKLLSLMTIAVGISVINVLYRLLVAQPLGMRTFESAGRAEFGHFIQHGNIDIFWFWIRALSTLTLALTLGMLVGAVLGLMTTRWKIITFIAAPIIGLGLLTFILYAGTNGGQPISFTSTWLGSLFRVMYGFDGYIRYQHPLNLVVTNFILSAICLAVSYSFNRLLRLRRV